MNEAQTRAFKAATDNVEPSVLNTLFIGALVAVLILWAGWGWFMYSEDLLLEKLMNRH